ncbi:MAG: rhodanese-like domain-containing protein [Myxococcota bacterium]
MNDQPHDDGWPEPGPISPDDARELLERGACLVDVRSPSEFRHEHIEGAINIPVHVLSAYYGDLVERNCPIIVCCRNAERSEVAFRVLRQMGLINVYDGGAVSNWL